MSTLNNLAVWIYIACVSAVALGALAHCIAEYLRQRRTCCRACHWWHTKNNIYGHCLSASGRPNYSLPAERVTPALWPHCAGQLSCSYFRSRKEG